MVRKTEQPKDQVHWGRIEHASEEAYRRKTLIARRRRLQTYIEGMRQQCEEDERREKKER